ncbi:hypothetical protein [Streptomyces sp. TM32]|uniref:hypothetical protein n=1 Tax=Streptomyces sp. TM32 TaxID=1652669 RepID=UPI0012AC4CDD|nr:hypothetical protein [Streptomyces sp. TM32]
MALTLDLALSSGGLMNFVLLRFALIAVGVLLLVLLGFAALMMLKRQGSIDKRTVSRASEQMGPIARNLIENRRGGQRGGQRGGRRGGQHGGQRGPRAGLLSTVLAALDDRARRR